MRNLLSITDFTVEEIDALISVAQDISKNPEAYQEKCKHKKLATLFFEPSTRTRLSFESAMLSLGGSTLGFSDANSSSASSCMDLFFGFAAGVGETAASFFIISLFSIDQQFSFHQNRK